MKLKKFTITTTTLLGAALLAHGQAQDRDTLAEERNTTEQSSPEAGAADRADAERPQEGAATQNDSEMRQGENTGSQEATEGRENAEQTANNSSDGKFSDEIKMTEAERAEKAVKLREMNWSDAEESEAQLSEIPERARNTLETVTAGASLNDAITVLKKDDHQVFKAEVTRENEENLHIVVQNDGTVVHTKQKVEFSDAPESVQNAIKERLDDGMDAPSELYRVIANEETSYVAKAKADDDDKKMIRVDNTGNFIEEKDKEAKDKSSDQQEEASDSSSD